ncbi:MAG: alpha-glucosidase [Tepidiphilus sp.]|nr:alpha-glucosidase [Tepidiphilus sp.]
MPPRFRPWQECVVYTVWPRSFADGNGDGIGDLAGLTERLDELRWLGVDALWLAPIHPSPNADYGYDVSDHLDVHPDFGTMADFRSLRDELHRRGMRLLLDLVINHTSVRHPWFLDSRSSRTSARRDWYYWRARPNDWESIFGGPAWTRDEVTGEYYLHLFFPEQPDLDWSNPAVRQALAEIARFWLDEGVDGFRFDALTVLKKEEGLPDVAPGEPGGPRPAWSRFLARPGLLDWVRDFAERAGITRDHLTLGEANGIAATEAPAWVGEPQGPLSALLHFELWHIDTTDAQGRPGLDTRAFSDTARSWYRALAPHGALPALYLENHDLPRIVSRWAPPERCTQAAKAFAAATYLQRGLAVLYQGQELGLPNARFTRSSDLRDPLSLRRIAALRAQGMSDAAILAEMNRSARDLSRTPIPWDANRPQAGFSSAEPWQPMDPAHIPLAWRQQREDEGSVLNFYREILARRRR